MILTCLCFRTLFVSDRIYGHTGTNGSKSYLTFFLRHIVFLVSLWMHPRVAHSTITGIQTEVLSSSSKCVCVR